MKKTYISPSISVVCFHSEDLMLSTSQSGSPLQKLDQADFGASGAYSGERGWSSDSWTDAE